MTNDSTFQPDPARLPQSSGKMDVQVVEEVTRLISRFQTDIFERMDRTDHSRIDQFADLRTRMDSRFDVRDREFDDLANRFDALMARMEERLAPFAELPARIERVETAVDHLDQQQSALTARLDAALDPSTPGATVAMVALQKRIATMERLVRFLLIAIGILALLSIAQGAGLLGHHYYIWERLR